MITESVLPPEEVTSAPDSYVFVESVIDSSSSSTAARFLDPRATFFWLSMISGITFMAELIVLKSRTGGCALIDVSDFDCDTCDAIIVG